MGDDKLHTADSFRVGQLRFRELSLDGEQSLYGSVSDDECNGIYAYEFTDGTGYVGLSKDVRKRHAQHLEEYRHKDPPLVMRRMYFAQVPKGDRALLERRETEAIAWFEFQKGVSLINKAKTSRPLGASAAAISVEGTFGIEIPWDRAERNLCLAVPANLDVCKDADRRERFSRLQTLPGAGRLLELAGEYVFQTMASPAASASTLWVATAFPGETEVALRITCGNLEVFVATQDESGFHGFVNFKMSRRGSRFSRLKTLIDHRRHARAISFPGYNVSQGVAAVSFFSLDQLERMLGDCSMLDACYKLNVEQMRRGPSMNRARSNGYLCEALLKKKADS